MRQKGKTWLGLDGIGWGTSGQNATGKDKIKQDNMGRGKKGLD